ncbi:hypothetical protein D9M68_876440 [compost metagenome]
MPTPPNRWLPVRNSDSANAHSTRAPPTSKASSNPANAGLTPQALATQTGTVPPTAMSKATRSSVLTRTTASTPRSVAKAANPMTKNTTRDLRLPAPMRSSVLLPQPDASTMPNPNSAPPTSADNQMMRPEE